MKKKLFLSLHILLSLVLLAWVVSLVPAGSWTALAAAPLHHIALATAAMIGNQALCAFRLYRLLRRPLPAAKFFLIFKGTWLGYFCSSFLPSSVGGDAVKLAWLAQNLGHGAAILAGMVVERVTSLMVTLVIVFVFLMRYASRQGYALAPGSGTLWLPASGIAGLALCCAIGIWAARSQHRYAALLRGYAGQIREALSSWRQAPGAVLEAGFWSAGTFVVAGLGVLLPIVWATGADISALQAIGCIAAATLLTLVPVAINGIGIYEAGLVGLLTMLGVTEAGAAQAAICLRLVLVIAALPGAYWLRFDQPDSPKMFS
jgi:uncharacterized membrane protein YbhN (UPF0104 family)